MNCKLTILFLLVTASIHFGWAQNLVLNGNFELVNVCTEYDEQCAPVAWRATSEKLYAYHKDGYNKYIRLMLFNKVKENHRKFAQTELLCPLEKGEQYEISMRIKANLFGINAICVGFSEDFVFEENLDYQSIYTNRHCEDIAKQVQSKKWVTIQFNYVALGTEKFMVIGNLQSDEETTYEVLDKKAHKKLKKSYQPQGSIEYGLDDVTVRHVDGLVCEDLQDRKQSVADNLHRHTGEWGVYVKEVVELVTVREEPAQEIKKAKSIAVSPEVIIPKEIVLNDLSFEHNAYILTSENIVELDPLMEMMKKDSSIRIKIIGHTSFIGEADYNKSLSLKRAESVRKYLVKKGITLQRMDAAGKGETEPIRFGHDDASLRMNRRVVIEIISTN